MVVFFKLATMFPLFLSILFACILQIHPTLASVSNNRNSKMQQIIHNPECQDEIPTRCEGNRTPLTDLEALNCILNHKREEVKEIKDSCNHALWEFRKSLMGNSGFYSAIDENCHAEIEGAGCGTTQSNQVNCAIDNKESIKSDDCRYQVSLVERVMFSDYAVIGRFADICQTDIRKFKCGRNDVSNHADETKSLPTSQGATIECLSRYISNVTKNCAIEVLRVAELQAEDYHLDRALYFACRDDRETFCKEVSPGSGKVYKCLLENKMESRMSDACRDQLLRRQKLVAQDFKVSSLPFACKSEIKKFKCRKGTDADKHVRLSQILLCLEGEGHNGQQLNGECVEEMRMHRKSLMEDHRATPELLADCISDSKKFCPNTKPVAGATIHCLMEHAMSPKRMERITSECRNRLEELLKVTDIGETWDVDPVLKDACQPVVQESNCRDVPSNQVMSCLMRLLTSDTANEADSHAMTDSCESALIQIQYFMTRDFTVNNVLYHDCRMDALSICGVSENWNEPMTTGQSGANPGSLVLSCLYRNLIGDSGKSVVSRQCGERVKEAMRERALLVSLNPELEQSCLEDLSDLCSEHTKPGEELKCLQINIGTTSKACKEAVIKFTEMEVRDPSIDPYLFKYCRDPIEKCNTKVTAKNTDLESPKSDRGDTNVENQEEDDNSDDMFSCLVKFKHELKNRKCKSRIDHLQLLQLSYIEFSSKFKTLCQSDVIRRCNDLEHMTASKLVNCLSEHVWNDTLLEQPHRISKPCRKQIKMLTLSKVQLENSSIADGMYGICRETVRILCPGIVPGEGRILECLRQRKEDITDQRCRAALFPLQESLDQDPGVDVFFTQECHFEIKTFCPEKVMNGDLLTCLKLNINQEGFDQTRCGKVLQTRFLEQNSDLRLNSRLRNACYHDIPKVCPKIQFGEGRILQCLKEEFVRPDNRLSASCKAHVEGFLQAAAQTDVRLDYTLYKMCNREIETSCKYPHKTNEIGENAFGDNGRIEECLKDLFHQNQLINPDCKMQVKLLIQSSQIDIHVDPLLNRACSLDLLKRCDGVVPGEGRLVACLLNEYDREIETGLRNLLSPQCRKLLGSRAELFELAGKPVAMESIQDLYVHVAESSHRNYFLIVAISLLGSIFVFGLFCGRATKRRAASKDK